MVDGERVVPNSGSTEKIVSDAESWSDSDSVLVLVAEVMESPGNTGDGGLLSALLTSPVSKSIYLVASFSLRPASSLGTSISFTTTTLAPISPAIISNVSMDCSRCPRESPIRRPSSVTPSS